MTPADLFGSFATASLPVVGWVIAGILASIGLWVTLFSIRKGLQFFFDLVARSGDDTPMQTWHHSYGWISEEKQQFLDTAFDINFAAGREAGMNEDDAGLFARHYEDDAAKRYDEIDAAYPRGNS